MGCHAHFLDVHQFIARTAANPLCTPPSEPIAPLGGSPKLDISRLPFEDEIVSLVDPDREFYARLCRPSVALRFAQLIQAVVPPMMERSDCWVVQSASQAVQDFALVVIQVVRGLAEPAELLME